MQRMAKSWLGAGFSFLIIMAFTYQLLKATAKYAPGPVAAGADYALDLAGFDDD